MQPHLDQPLDPEAADAADAQTPPTPLVPPTRPLARGRASPSSSRRTPAISHPPRASWGPSRSP